MTPSNKWPDPGLSYYDILSQSYMANSQNLDISVTEWFIKFVMNVGNSNSRLLSNFAGGGKIASGWCKVGVNPQKNGLLLKSPEPNLTLDISQEANC